MEPRVLLLSAVGLKFMNVRSSICFAKIENVTIEYVTFLMLCFCNAVVVYSHALEHNEDQGGTLERLEINLKIYI